MCPGIRFPLMTRDGSVPAPTEPGFRCRVLPWVAGPPPMPYRCTTPWNPRPLVVPVTLTVSPAAKIATVMVSPDFGDSPATPNSRSTDGAASTPAALAWPASAFGVRVAFFSPKPSCTLPSFTWKTRQGPASITVHGTLSPFSMKTLVMPSLRPISPLVMASPHLDLDIHPCGQVELGQGVHGLRTRIVDVEQPFVGAELELLAALLVDMRAPQHRPALDLRRERDGAGHLRAGLLGGPRVVSGGLVEHAVVERLQSDPDLASHLRPRSSVFRAEAAGADVRQSRASVLTVLRQDLGDDAG